MPVCSYVVFPRPGAATRLAEHLAALPGCQVEPADNRDLLLMVTDTPDAEAEHALRDRLESLEDVLGMVLAFGEIDPDTPEGDPLARGRSGDPRRPPAEPRAASRGTDPSETS